MLPTEAARFSRTLGQIEALFARFEQPIEALQVAPDEDPELKHLRGKLAQRADEMETEFARIKTLLEEKGLPTVIRERHRIMVETYRQELETLFNNLDAIETASDTTARKAAVKRAREHLKAKKNRRSQQPFDPNNLPNRVLQPQSDHKPKLKKDAFIQSGLHDTPYIKLAALGDFSYDGLPGADDPAYLAETDEIIDYAKENGIKTYPLNVFANGEETAIAFLMHEVHNKIWKDKWV